MVQAQPPSRRPGRRRRAHGFRDHGRIGGRRRLAELAQRQSSPSRTRRKPRLASSRETNEQAAIAAKNEAIAATKAEALAREKEKQAREKAEALVEGAFAQNRNALEAQRVLSVLLNQRLLSIPGTQDLREELISTTLTGLEATIASLEQLGTVARDKEGFALATRTLRGNQPARRADRHGIRQVRRDRPLLPPHGRARRATAPPPTPTGSSP